MAYAYNVDSVVERVIRCSAVWKRKDTSTCAKIGTLVVGLKLKRYKVGCPKGWRRRTIEIRGQESVAIARSDVVDHKWPQ